jgi:Spy/CpxP family protein refolding chaperone
MRIEHYGTQRAIWLVAVAATALAAPLTGWAQDAGDRPLIREAAGWQVAAGHGPIMGGGFGERFADRVGLSQEQRDVIRGLIDRGRPTAEALRDEMRANRTRLMDTPADDPDFASVVDQVAESNGRIVSQLVRHRAQLRAEIAAVMTPDQRERARVLKTEIRETVEQRVERHREMAGDLIF